MTELYNQAHAFAAELTGTVQSVVGPSCAPFVAVEIEAADAFTVRQQPADGIILSGDEGPLLRLSVEYKCTLDGDDRYLAVEESAIHVFVEPGGREPLFRYEYMRAVSPKLPAAHIQFHGRHPELERAMQDCGGSTPRAKRRKNGKKPILLSALHFPVGGTRFRPALEDVLEMLIEEFGVRPEGSVAQARTAIAAGRERWRRMQVSTVVRDAPSEAARTLEELGYSVAPPEEGPKPDKIGQLRMF